MTIIIFLRKCTIVYHSTELREYRKPCKNSEKVNTHLSVEMRNTCYSWEVLKEKVVQKKGRNKSDENKDDNIDAKAGGKLTEMQTLFNIDLSIEKGSLIGVAGLVGSGKSSLLSAMLGEVT